VDEAVNRFARDLIDAITFAVARDPKVLACQRRAREAGIELKLAFEAKAVSGEGESRAAGGAAVCRPETRSRAYEITAADRRFLRSLRIAVDEANDADGGAED
jgi:hypothetical protein